MDKDMDKDMDKNMDDVVFTHGKYKGETYKYVRLTTLNTSCI
jgi:hypothetical protein